MSGTPSNVEFPAECPKSPENSMNGLLLAEAAPTQANMPSINPAGASRLVSFVISHTFQQWPLEPTIHYLDRQADILGSILGFERR